MSKIAKIASSVLSVVALIPGPWQPFVQAAAMLTGIVAQLTAKKPAIQGQQTSWRADPSASSVIALGWTLAPGEIRYNKAHGKNNKYNTLVTVLSGCGPCEELTGTYADKKLVSFSGTAAQGDMLDRFWQAHQLGACPEAAALSSGIDTPPGWTAAHKLSGYCAVIDTFLFDGKGDKTFTSLPAMAWKIKGVKGYDARADSTYPGGSGTQRSNDETTRGWSQNPWTMAVTFALGWHQGPQSVRVGGVGMPIEAIDLPAFVEASNVADANDWKVGGMVSTGDDKWEVLKSICQAGGGEPVRYGAILSCIVNAPKISIATITRADLVAEASVATVQRREDRLNGIIPRYRSEDHHFEVVPASVIRNEDYLAQDGGKKRTREIAYPLVQCFAGQSPAQVAQLAAYDIANGREATPIVLPLKLRWIGFRAGDCLTIEDTPEFGWLAGRDVVVLKRQLDPETGTVVLTVRTETHTKHAWALSQTGVAAPITDTPEEPDLEGPDPGEWDLAGGTVEGDESIIPALVFDGLVADPTATGIVFSYYQGEEEPASEDDWIAGGTAPTSTTHHVITSVGAGIPYMGSVQYVFGLGKSTRLVLGPVTTGELVSGGTDAPELLTNETGELLTNEVGDYLRAE